MKLWKVNLGFVIVLYENRGFGILKNRVRELEIRR